MRFFPMSHGHQLMGMSEWLGPTEFISIRTRGARGLGNARLLRFHRSLTLLTQVQIGKALSGLGLPSGPVLSVVGADFSDVLGPPHAHLVPLSLPVPAVCVCVCVSLSLCCWTRQKSVSHVVVREESESGGREGPRTSSALGLVEYHPLPRLPTGRLLVREQVEQPAVRPWPEAASEACFASACSRDLVSVAGAYRCLIPKRSGDPWPGLATPSFPLGSLPVAYSQAAEGARGSERVLGHLKG